MTGYEAGKTGLNAQLDAKITGYDFLDFGCSQGRSIAFARERLGGTRGLGIDIDPRKVLQARNLGFDVLEADASTLDSDRFDGIRFVIMSHFLEHLPTFDLARRIMTSAINTASEFVFIRQPYFEADGYLFGKGLKLYWSDWEGHRNKMSSLDFYRVCERLNASGAFKRFCVARRYPVLSSSDDVIINLHDGHDRHKWERGSDREKPAIHFSEGTVFQEICCVMSKQAEFTVEVRSFLKYSEILFDSANVAALPQTGML